jgi:hypothetical protein
MSKKIFDRKTDYLILGFVVALALMLGFCEDAEADWSLEYYHDSNAGSTAFNQGLDRVGARYTFESGTSMYFAPLMAVGGDIRPGFEFGMGEKLWKRWEGQIQLAYYDEEMDGGFTIRRVIGDGPFQMSLGGTYWINESPGSNSDFTFNLGMRYNF